jgi:hypothetical protein
MRMLPKPLSELHRVLTASEGVTDGDSPTPWVNPFVGDSNLVNGIESLRSKRLVDLTKTVECGIRYFRG